MGAARKTTHTHQINGGTAQLLAENTYDELGKLISKKVGNTSATPRCRTNPFVWCMINKQKFPTFTISHKDIIHE